MKRIHTILILLFFAAFAPSAFAQSTPAAGATQLYMVSNPGDYIGGGQTYSFTPANGSFSAGGLDHDHDGLVDYVTIGFTGPGQRWNLTFTTTQLHLELKPGFYDTAMRAPFATAGHPGLEVTGDGRGCNTVTGSFTVLQATFDYSSGTPQVISFAAQFEQHCEGGPISLAGVIYYNYTPTSSLRANPTTVNGGETVKGIVVLTDPAPPGGALVHLASGNVALATVPSSVPVPQGSKFADFPISTTRIKSPSSVVILASYHGVSSAATLRVVSPIPSITRLSLQGEAGDFIVGSHEYVFTPRDGFFRTWGSANGAGNYFRLAYNDAPFTNSWSLHITTRNLNVDLVPGYYTNAQRYPFEAAGHPGLSLSGNGRGCNTLIGEFTVLDAAFDYSSSEVQVVSFAADFIQHCEGATPAARGSIYYNYTPPSECVLSIAPLSQSFSGNEGMGSFNVTQARNCSWTAAADVAWITILSGGGAGNGTVTFLVRANAGASNRTGTITVAGQTFTVVQSVDFLDVPKTHFFYTEIAKLAARGVTVGCANGHYCPDEPVTRQQMAALVIKALGEFSPLPTATQRFDDVPATVNGQPHPFYSFIDRLASFGITSGCGANNQGQPLYCPDDPVTREQVAALIIRALGEYSPPVPASQMFSDVPPSNPFYAFIDRLGALGITGGCGGGNFCPGDYVTRGQMAALLVRAFGL